MGFASRSQARKPVPWAAVLGVAVASAACERGCGRTWLGAHGVGEAPPPGAPASLPLRGLDCPDGLARCTDGNVEASRLAMIAQPCRGPESVCACPWEPAGVCDGRCVADGLELVIERDAAAAQLCAPVGRAFDLPAAGDRLAPPGCDEGQLYRCAARVVTDCLHRRAIGSCLRGCFAEGASIEDEVGGISREAALAILCLR
jgi:hypothetical protein